MLLPERVQKQLYLLVGGFDVREKLASMIARIDEGWLIFLLIELRQHRLYYQSLYFFCEIKRYDFAMKCD
jgi:hypothetical protein